MKNLVSQAALPHLFFDGQMCASDDEFGHPAFILGHSPNECYTAHCIWKKTSGRLAMKRFLPSLILLLFLSAVQAADQGELTRRGFFGVATAPVEAGVECRREDHLRLARKFRRYRRLESGRHHHVD